MKTFSLPKLTWLFFAGLAGLLTGAALAAPDLSAVPPPVEPFVAAPPENAEWTISVSPQRKGKDGTSDSDGKPEKTPLSAPGGVIGIKSTKTGKIKRDVVSYSSRPAQEYWFAGDYIITLRSNKKDYAVVDSSIMNPRAEIKGIYREFGRRILSPGFPGFDWIKKNHYQGVVFFEKTRPSYYYALKGPDPETGESIVAAEAWIDVETMLPLRYSSEGIDFTYRFEEPPSSRLQLPVVLTGVNLN